MTNMKYHKRSKVTATRKENKGDAEEDRASEMGFEEWVRFTQGDGEEEVLLLSDM